MFNVSCKTNGTEMKIFQSQILKYLGKLGIVPDIRLQLFL